MADSGCDLRAYPGGHRRSGATSIPEGLRLVPGVEVARVNSNVWAVDIREFGSAFSMRIAAD